MGACVCLCRRMSVKVRACVVCECVRVRGCMCVRLSVHMLVHVWIRVWCV